MAVIEPNRQPMGADDLKVRYTIDGAFHRMIIPQKRLISGTETFHLESFLSWGSDLSPSELRSERGSSWRENATGNRRPAFYPDNFSDDFELAIGFEPMTCGLRNRCSTAELRQLEKKLSGLLYH